MSIPSRARSKSSSGVSVQTVLDRLGIAHGLVHVVMVNDAMEIDRSRPLAEGDSLVILPPVAGGG